MQSVETRLYIRRVEEEGLTGHSLVLRMLYAKDSLREASVKSYESPPSKEGMDFKGNDIQRGFH